MRGTRAALATGIPSPEDAPASRADGEHLPRRLSAAKRTNHTETQGTAVAMRLAVLSLPTSAKMLPNTRSHIVKVPKFPGMHAGHIWYHGIRMTRMSRGRGPANSESRAQSTVELWTCQWGCAASSSEVHSFDRITDLNLTAQAGAK